MLSKPVRPAKGTTVWIYPKSGKKVPVMGRRTTVLPPGFEKMLEQRRPFDKKPQPGVCIAMAAKAQMAAEQKMVEKTKLPVLGELNAEVRKLKLEAGATEVKAGSKKGSGKANGAGLQAAVGLETPDTSRPPPGRSEEGAAAMEPEEKGEVKNIMAHSYSLWEKSAGLKESWTQHLEGCEATAVERGTASALEVDLTRIPVPKEWGENMGGDDKVLVDGARSLETRSSSMQELAAPGEETARSLKSDRDVWSAPGASTGWWSPVVKGDEEEPEKDGRDMSEMKKAARDRSEKHGTASWTASPKKKLVVPVSERNEKLQASLKTIKAKKEQSAISKANEESRTIQVEGEELESEPIKVRSLLVRMDERLSAEGSRVEEVFSKRNKRDTGALDLGDRIRRQAVVVEQVREEEEEKDTSETSGIRCASGCGEWISHSDLLGHVEVCPDNQVSCPFLKSCEWYGSRHRFEEHYGTVHGTVELPRMGLENQWIINLDIESYYLYSSLEVRDQLGWTGYKFYVSEMKSEVFGMITSDPVLGLSITMHSLHFTRLTDHFRYKIKIRTVDEEFSGPMALLGPADDPSKEGSFDGKVQLLPEDMKTWIESKGPIMSILIKFGDCKNERF